MLLQNTPHIVKNRLFQPRFLTDPEHPESSPWELAVLHPDADEQGFMTIEAAFEATKAWCDENGKSISGIRVVEILTTETYWNVKEDATDAEVSLRMMWVEKGIPEQKQQEILADITSRAQPGSKVGPFSLKED